MPKNNPTPNTPRPLRPKFAGAEGGSPQQEVLPLLVALVDLNIAILPELQPGSPTVLRNEGTQLRVFTPLGTYVGAVSEDEGVQLKELKIRATRIFAVTPELPKVLIEVRI